MLIQRAIECPISKYEPEDNLWWPAQTASQPRQPRDFTKLRTRDSLAKHGGSYVRHRQCLWDPTSGMKPSPSLQHTSERRPTLPELTSHLNIGSPLPGSLTKPLRSPNSVKLRMREVGRLKQLRAASPTPALKPRSSCGHTARPSPLMDPAGGVDCGELTG